MNNNKGITIITLVVTIIILILLAGVSINLTLGKNGIITIAKQAKENIELAKIEEETALNELYTQMESDGENSGLNYDAITLLREFRKKIALAITNEGVETLETDTADTMSQNIGKIKDNIFQEGATATEDKILKDYTAYKDGKLLTGTMENYAGQTVIASSTSSDDTNIYLTIPEAGYYDNNSKISTSNSNLITNLDDFKSVNASNSFEATIEKRYLVCVTCITGGSIGTTATGGDIESYTINADTPGMSGLRASMRLFIIKATSNTITISANGQYSAILYKEL